MRLTDHLNHILGTYVATGVNNPKKYPRKPLLKQPSSGSKKTQTARQMASMLGAKINE